MKFSQCGNSLKENFSFVFAWQSAVLHFYSIIRIESIDFLLNHLTDSLHFSLNLGIIK